MKGFSHFFSLKNSLLAGCVVLGILICANKEFCLQWFPKEVSGNQKESGGVESFNNSRDESMASENTRLQDSKKGITIAPSKEEHDMKSNGEGSVIPLETIEDVMYQNQLRQEANPKAELMYLSMYVLGEGDIKKEPDEESVKITGLIPGDEVHAYRLEDDWYFVAYQGYEGYTAVSLLGTYEDWKLLQKTGATEAGKHPGENNRQENEKVKTEKEGPAETDSQKENGAWTVPEKKQETAFSDSEEEPQKGMGLSQEQLTALAESQGISVEELFVSGGSSNAGSSSGTENRPLSEEELIQIYAEHGINYEEIQLY